MGAPTIRTDSDEEEEQEEVTEKAVRAAPPWLISGVVHMIALILMGILYLSTNQDGNKVQIEAIYAETEGVQLEENLLQDPGLMELTDVKEPALSFDVMKVDDPFAVPPQLDPSLLSLDATTSVSDLVAPSIGMALTGREKGAKEGQGQENSSRS